jgi:hypothetical protein
VGAWAYTYENLDSETQALFTRDEWSAAYPLNVTPPEHAAKHGAQVESSQGPPTSTGQGTIRDGPSGTPLCLHAPTSSSSDARTARPGHRPLEGGRDPQDQRENHPARAFAYAQRTKADLRQLTGYPEQRLTRSTLGVAQLTNPAGDLYAIYYASTPNAVRCRGVRLT